MPIDIVKPFLELLEKSGKAPRSNGALHEPIVAGIALNA
jgi:hypothetical protein